MTLEAARNVRQCGKGQRWIIRQPSCLFRAFPARLRSLSAKFSEGPLLNSSVSIRHALPMAAIRRITAHPSESSMTRGIAIARLGMPI